MAVLVSLSAISSTGHGQGAAFSERSLETGVLVEHDPSDAFTISQIDISPMTAGGLVGDFNNDGWQDLLVIVSGGGPDKLFINGGNGTFTDQAAAWGVAVEHMGLGGAVGDYDDDGDLDVFLSSVGPATGFPVTGANLLYRNNGNGTFSEVAEAAGVNLVATGIADGFGAAFGDYDLDGDLDLATTGWVSNSQANKLFANNGDGTFTDVTAEAGLVDHLEIRGFGPMFADMNGDRYPELLIAADFETSRYFINDGDGTFTEYTGPSGTGLDGNGMGQVVADLNRDTLPDWYVTSIYTPDSSLLFVPGTGNMLYLNNANHTYLEASEAALCKDGGWGWGTVAIDIDHDGWLDLIETNGWFQFNYGQPEWQNEQAYVWRNLGNAVFEEISQECGLIHDLYGRGMVNFDYDNDGDQDVVIFSHNAEAKLFRNDHDLADGAYLRVFLDTSANDALAPNGYGSHVVATAGGVEHHRWIFGGSHYISQSELSAHFGLAGAATIDELRVEWNDGSVTILEDVAVNQTLTIAAGAGGLLGDIDGDGEVNVDDLVLLILAWGQAGSAADLDQDGTVDVQDLILLILNWSD